MFGLTSIACASSEEKLKVCRSLGANHTINYKEFNTKEKFIEEIMTITEKHGVDYILDPIFASNFDQNVGCLALDARWVSYGFLGGNTVDNFNYTPIFRKRGTLLSSTLRSRSVEYKTQLMRNFEKECGPKFEQGILKVIIDKEFDMTELPQAMAYIDQNKAIGKVIVRNDLFHIKTEDLYKEWKAQFAAKLFEKGKIYPSFP